jgi:hypothetical protein
MAIGPKPTPAPSRSLPKRHWPRNSHDGDRSDCHGAQSETQKSLPPLMQRNDLCVD